MAHHEMPREDRLNEFELTAQQLEDFKHYSQCLAGILNLGLDLSDGGQLLTGVMTGVDLDDLRGYLVAFRKFTMDRETVFVQKVYRDALKEYEGSRIAGWLKRSQKRWKQICQKGRYANPSYGSSDNGKAFEGFKLWLYGHPRLFHGTEGTPERAIYDRMASDSRAFLEAVALQFIREGVREIKHVRKILRYGALIRSVDAPRPAQRSPVPRAAPRIYPPDGSPICGHSADMSQISKSTSILTD
jgi:hypothetical protein